MKNHSSVYLSRSKDLRPEVMLTLLNVILLTFIRESRSKLELCLHLIQNQFRYASQLLVSSYYNGLQLKETERISILYGDRVTGTELAATQITGYSPYANT